VYAGLDDIDWDRWAPVWRATLLFVIRDGQILLIDKKRGFGKGKINGPGGRLEPGETPEQAAVREFREELVADPVGVRARGELFFQFRDGHSIHGFVFRADDIRGEVRETDEAAPLWFGLDAIPYGRMWADDPYWLPLVVREQSFRGHFLFDGDAMLDHRVVVGP
jgi:8-oxo-dGTP diphosphatase